MKGIVAPFIVSSERTEDKRAAEGSGGLFAPSHALIRQAILQLPAIHTATCQQVSSLTRRVSAFAICTDFIQTNKLDMLSYRKKDLPTDFFL